MFASDACVQIWYRGYIWLVSLKIDIHTCRWRARSSLRSTTRGHPSSSATWSVSASPFHLSRSTRSLLIAGEKRIAGASVFSDVVSSRRRISPFALPVCICTFTHCSGLPPTAQNRDRNRYAWAALADTPAHIVPRPVISSRRKLSFRTHARALLLTRPPAHFASLSAVVVSTRMR